MKFISYLIDHNFITIDQFAYLKNHSTQTCLHRLIDDILENINADEITGLCFLDIKKCFDSIDHNILLTKLQRYGIKGNELSWFRSYLHNRSQIVINNGKKSDKCFVNIGVPQGTILGPVLFLLYVNDLSNSVINANINIYADDVVIYCSSESLPDLSINLQNNINSVYDWYTNNKLILSVDKCSTMVISNKISSTIENFTLYLGTTPLSHVHEMKYLGLTIDDHLKWNSHKAAVS